LLPRVNPPPRQLRRRLCVIKRGDDEMGTWPSKWDKSVGTKAAVPSARKVLKRTGKRGKEEQWLSGRGSTESTLAKPK